VLVAVSAIMEKGEKKGMATYGKAGFGFVDVIERPSEDSIAAFRGFFTPNVADVLGRFAGMNPAIKPVKEGLKLCGPAITVRLRPADNLMVHKAVDIAHAGDVIVVDTGGNYTNAPWGELLTLSCLKKGIAGVVIDGVVRDVAAIRKLGFPVFCCGSTPNGCDKDGPGEVNTTITCGGVTVNPGDMILGDDDGVVVVPLSLVDDVIVKTKNKVAQEEKRRQEIAQGVIVRPEIDETLRKRSVIP